MKKGYKIQDMLPALFTVIALMLFSCGNNNNEADAYGNFEADEIIVSAESQGELIEFVVVEGAEVTKGKLIGRIDSSVAAIKKEQLLAQDAVINARMWNLDAQLNVQEEQHINMVREVNRIERMLDDKAATQQQYDDIAGKLKVLDTQTEALRSQKSIILGERSVLKAQLGEVANMMEKCRITSPLSGTVLEKYVDAGELVTPGKALFKVANINDMELKVYISGNQLANISIGDTVTTLIDGSDGSMQQLTGVVSWISSQVEFTPKIIQTREERVNMVYAVKVRVKNDGRLKIGMPGEIIFGRTRNRKL